MTRNRQWVVAGVTFVVAWCMGAIVLGVFFSVEFVGAASGALVFAGVVVAMLHGGALYAPTEEQRYERWRHHRCIGCNYDVRGLATCPECGREVASEFRRGRRTRWEGCLHCGFLNAPQRTTICLGCGNPLDMSSMHFCLRCGYDMHGLPSSVCPECGDDALGRLA